MYRRRFRKPSRPAVFGLLMLASAALLLLPTELLGPARHLTQLIAVAQYSATAAGQQITEPLRKAGEEPVPADRYQDEVRSRQSLENENVVLRQRIVQLQATADELRRIRSQPGFPAEGVIVPGQVIAWDAVPGRESLLTKGRGAKVGDWVTSHLAVKAGGQDGVQEKQAVLAREALIGWVDQASPLMCRVVLLSDPAASKARLVHIATKREGQETAFVADVTGRRPADFALAGLGGGRMKVMDIDARYVNEKLIKVGDLVISDDRDQRLPMSLVIGEIIELRQVRKQSQKPLLYEAVVKHRLDTKSINEVYIVNLSR